MSENLEHYLTLWDLSNPQVLTQTATSHLYTVNFAGETAVLKLLTDYGWEEQRGAAALGCFNGHGAVRLYLADEKAQLLEYADGVELVTLVEQGDDAGATRIIAELLKQIHGTGQTMPCDGVFPLDQWFIELFKKLKPMNAPESSRSIGMARRSLPYCWLNRVTCACCTAIFTIATFANRRVVGWHLTRKG